MTELILTAVLCLIVGAVIGMSVYRAVAHKRSRLEAESAEVPRTGRVSISQDRLNELAGDPLFAVFVLLGRMSNALRFAHTAPLEVYNEGTPRASRQLLGGFLLQIAVAQEALDSLRKMNPTMKDRTEWQHSIVPLLRDPEVKELESEILRDLRRKIAFHFDMDALTEGIREVPNGDALLLATRGTQAKDVYFPFSDEAAISFLFSGKGLSRTEHVALVRPWAQRATDLSVRIATEIESVATEIARELGLKGVWGK